MFHIHVLFPVAAETCFYAPTYFGHQL